ncbi:MAG: ferritin family protein [Desulfatiglandales bacterium]
MAKKRDLTTVSGILEAALEKEMEAHEFYGKLLAQRSSSTIRRVLEKLKDEEYKHIRLIRRMLADLNLGREVGRPE